jgi:hypothetical protein
LPASICLGTTAASGVVPSWCGRVTPVRPVNFTATVQDAVALPAAPSATGLAPQVPPVTMAKLPAAAVLIAALMATPETFATVNMTAPVVALVATSPKSYAVTAPTALVACAEVTDRLPVGVPETTESSSTPLTTTLRVSEIGVVGVVTSVAKALN